MGLENVPSVRVSLKRPVIRMGAGAFELRRVASAFEQDQASKRPGPSDSHKAPFPGLDRCEKHAVTVLIVIEVQ
jgi:hypothetical protein